MSGRLSTQAERAEFAERVFEAAGRAGNARVRASLEAVRALLPEATRVARKTPDGWGALLGAFSEPIGGPELEALLERIDRRIGSGDGPGAGYSLFVFGRDREVWLVSDDDPPAQWLSDLLADPKGGL